MFSTFKPPKVEIIYTPLQEAAERGLVYDATRHYIMPDSNWVEVLREALDMPELFVMFHLETGKFVLAGWLYDPMKDGVGVMVELETFSGPPDRRPGDLPTFKYLRSRLKPFSEHATEIKKNIKRAHYRRIARRNDEREAKKDFIAYLRRKGKYVEAQLIQDGKVQWLDPTFGGDLHDFTVDRVSRMSKEADAGF